VNWKGPLGQILIGVVLMLVSIALAFLMVLKLIPSTFALNFLAFGLSVVGLGIGLVGVSQYVHPDRRRRDRE